MPELRIDNFMRGFFYVYTKEPSSVETIAEQISQYWTDFRGYPGTAKPRLFDTKEQATPQARREIPQYKTPTETNPEGWSIVNELEVRLVDETAECMFEIRGGLINPEEINRFRLYLARHT